MGRPKKPIEVPGQEPETGAELITGTTGEATAPGSQRVASLLDDAALAERNTLLATINEQGAAIIARFETLGYTDLADQQLTDNIEFLQLVKKATTAEPAAPLGYVTNDEGKRQPVTGKPVLTEHGWHVPG
ncbi:hypothetical protein RJO31_004361 [Enterobacter hormaechei]|nr:hypothetical protein [Enterobacter hormaechei]